MLIKNALLKLDPDTRAFTLVGAFMGYFALLEAGIDSAVGEVLGVKGARRVIVGRNMGFDDKIKTLRALVHFFVPSKDDAKRFDDLAKRARTYGEMRNIVAHTPFRPSTSTDGVQFILVKATSKLEFPEMDLSIDEFLDHIDTINQIDNDLRSIEKRMTFYRIAEVLMKASDADEATPASAPTLGGLFGLGGAIGFDQND